MTIRAWADEEILLRTAHQRASSAARPTLALAAPEECQANAVADRRRELCHAALQFPTVRARRRAPALCTLIRRKSSLVRGNLKRIRKYTVYIQYASSVQIYKICRLNRGVMGVRLAINFFLNTVYIDSGWRACYPHSVLQAMQQTERCEGSMPAISSAIFP